MNKQELIFAAKDLTQVAGQILKNCDKVQVVTLHGTLGAGKTTLAIEFLRQLGVRSEMQSPTYTYVQLYKNEAGKNFYHFDLYRLQDKTEFLFAGFDEFLYQPDSLVIIEWPEIIEPLLDKNVCAIELQYVDDATRKISWVYR